MNALDRIEQNLADQTFDAVSDADVAQLVKVARAAQTIDLREQDVAIGPLRSAIQELHAELVPLLTELPE